MQDERNLLIIMMASLRILATGYCKQEQALGELCEGLPREDGLLNCQIRDLEIAITDAFALLLTMFGRVQVDLY